MNSTNPEFDICLARRRIKPLVGTSAIERLLLRHVDCICPESRLGANVIRQSFVDLCGAAGDTRRDARRFFHDGRLNYWCDLLGLNPEFVREIALKTGYLPAEPKGGKHA